MILLYLLVILLRPCLDRVTTRRKTLGDIPRMKLFAVAWTQEVKRKWKKTVNDNSGGARKKIFTQSWDEHRGALDSNKQLSKNILVRQLQMGDDVLLQKIFFVIIIFYINCFFPYTDINCFNRF